MKTNIVKSKKKGFGIIEVLIGGMVIVSVLVAIVGIGKMSLSAAEGNRQRIKATYIAQDGIEKLRRLRDSNWIDGVSGTEWDSPVSGQKITTALNNDPGHKLNYYFSGSILTQHGTTKESISTADQSGFVFSRYFTIEQVGGLLPTMNLDLTTSNTIKNSDAILVTSVVTWPKGSSTEKIELREILTDWRANY